MIALPSISAYFQGRDILLASNRDIGDAMYLAKAAKVVREEILTHTQSFNESFPLLCQDKSVSPSLKAFFSIILKGPGSMKKEENARHASLSVFQVIIYNTTTRQSRKSSASTATRHTRSKECPLPIYVTIKIHEWTGE